MNNLGVFSLSDLKNYSQDLVQGAENGQLSIITKDGSPMILAVPFDSELLKLGLNKWLALYLFEKKALTLSQASKIAKLSIDEFLEVLKKTNIDVVDYPENEIDSDLENIL